MGNERENRARAYQIKADREFRCEGCGATRRVLAVTIDGEPGTRCIEKCLDRRSHKPIPGQFDEGEEAEDIARKERARR